MHHAFLCISLPSLHVYDVKIPNFMFYRGCKHVATKFSFSLLLWIRLLGIHLQKGSHTFDKVSEFELLRWRFKKPRTYFLSDVLPAVAVLASLKGSYFLFCCSGCTSVRYTLDTDPFKYVNRWIHQLAEGCMRAGFAKTCKECKALQNHFTTSLRHVIIVLCFHFRHHEKTVTV